MAQIGRTERGGVNRQALTPEDGQSRALLAKWAEDRGYTVAIDPMANVFVRREGLEPSAHPILTGSHLDTQPTGGRFDGVYGVLAGFEALETLDDIGVETRRPIEVVVWTNEEGCRFEPGAAGSSAFVGANAMKDLLAGTDADGVTFEHALQPMFEATPRAEQRPLGFPIHAYVENHIEQGPILEREQKSIGVVTSVQGTRWYSIDVWGEAGHAGTTPIANRKDALRAAIDLIEAFRISLRDDSDLVRFTVGCLEVISPNSINTVPEHVRFTVDLRHPDNDHLERLASQLNAACLGLSSPCKIDIKDKLNMPATNFAPDVVDLVRERARRLGFSSMDLASGAFHDAKYLAERYPVGMIFVPCEKGLSHNEAESAKPADLAAGTAVLTEVLVELANQ